MAVVADPRLVVIEPDGSSFQYKGRRSTEAIVAFLRNETIEGDSQAKAYAYYCHVWRARRAF